MKEYTEDELKSMAPTAVREELLSFQRKVQELNKENSELTNTINEGFMDLQGKNYELAVEKESLKKQIARYEKALRDINHYLNETYEESDLRKSEDDFALGAYNTCKAIYDILEGNDIVFEEN